MGDGVGRMYAYAAIYLVVLLVTIAVAILTAWNSGRGLKAYLQNDACRNSKRTSARYSGVGGFDTELPRIRMEIE
jgi:SNF family Na+-dependent transporter